MSNHLADVLPEWLQFSQQRSANNWETISKESGTAQAI